MGKLIVGLMAGLVAMALTGCGQTPASAPSATYKAATKAAAKTAPAAKKAPSVSSRPATKAPAKPAATPAPTEQAPAENDETGSLKVDLKVSGNAPVAKLALKVFDQADPTVSADIPLNLTNGGATWAEDALPAGRYTLQVQALDAADKLLGSGNGEAIVTAGKATEVALEIRANVVAPADTSSDPDPTTPTTPTAPGGTIGLNIEIY